MVIVVFVRLCATTTEFSCEMYVYISLSRCRNTLIKHVQHVATVCHSCLCTCLFLFVHLKWDVHSNFVNLINELFLVRFYTTIYCLHNRRIPIINKYI